MPELPEVETTRQALLESVEGAWIEEIKVYQTRLRWPLDTAVTSLRNCTIRNVYRRSKYLLFELDEGMLLGHFGMTGHLRLHETKPPVHKHDIFDCRLRGRQGQLILRYTDIRRFGFWLYLQENPWQHPLLEKLGPEPLSEGFHGEYLYRVTRGKNQCIKSLIMDNHKVVGVGNIYANESLFHAGIHPMRRSSSLSLAETSRLCHSIKVVLLEALQLGGTTLKDFMNPTGNPGYFRLHLQVYGRAGQPCSRCHSLISSQKIAGRQTSFCANCQPEL